MREIVSPLDGIRSPFGFIRGGGVVPFSPLSLFASGEEGAWYEPSTTTCFTDTGGMTAAGVGDPVALMLDKSQQTTFNARRNLLNYSEKFDNAVWTKIGGSISPDTVETTDPLGGNTADKIINVSGINAYQEKSGAISEIRTFSVYLKKSGTESSCELYIYQVGVAFVVAFDFNFDTETSTLTQGAGSASIQSVGGGWYRCSVTATLPASATYSHGVYNATEVYAWGAQLEEASSASAYQATDTLPVEWAGNHATQSSAPARPILARVPEGGRRNLLEYTEEFDNAYWTGTATVAANAVDKDGNANEAYTFTDDNASGFEFIQANDFPISDSTPYYAYSVHFKKTTSASSFPAMAIVTGGGGTAIVSSYTVDTDNGSVTPRSGTDLVASSSVVSAGDYWRVSLTFAPNASNTQVDIQIYPAVNTDASGTWVSSTTGDCVVDAIQFEALTALGDATAYQKVVDQYDITEAGVTSLEYLAFDGSDDELDITKFSVGPASSVFLGLEPASEITAATTFQNILSARTGEAPTNGALISFGITTGNATNETFTWLTFNGTGNIHSRSNISAVPHVFTLNYTGAQNGETMRFDGADEVFYRGVNPFNASRYPSDYGSISSGGTFDGKLFSLIVRGAASTAQEISDTESYVANLSGVTLP